MIIYYVGQMVQKVARNIMKPILLTLLLDGYICHRVITFGSGLSFHIHMSHTVLCLVPVYSGSCWKVDLLLPGLSSLFTGKNLCPISSNSSYVVWSFIHVSVSIHMSISSPYIVSNISSILLFTDFQLTIVIVILLLHILLETFLINGLMFSLCIPMFFFQTFLPSLFYLWITFQFQLLYPINHCFRECI